MSSPCDASSLRSGTCVGRSSGAFRVRWKDGGEAMLALCTYCSAWISGSEEVRLVTAATWDEFEVSKVMRS